MKHILTLLMLLLPFHCFTQTVVSSNAQLSIGENTTMTTNSDFNNNGNLVFSNLSNANNQATLILAGNLSFTSTSAVIIPNLTITNEGTKVLNGDFTINKQLNLTGGLLAVETGSSLVMNKSAIFNNNLNGSSYITGPLTHLGNGMKFFPIGLASQYAPIMLENVLGSAGTSTTMAVRQGGLTLAALPTNVTDASSSWAWSFSSTGFSGSGINIPILAGDDNLFTGDNLIGVVLEADEQAGSVRNLGGFGSTLNGQNSILSREVGLGENRIFLLGAELSLVPIIHNIITPNGDNVNDYLIIDAISAYADDNEVIILDRWGAEVLRIKNFKNYNDTDNPYDGKFDFLAAGNYICILKYAGATAKQVITVLN